MQASNRGPLRKEEGRGRYEGEMKVVVHAYAEVMNASSYALLLLSIRMGEFRHLQQVQQQQQLLSPANSCNSCRCDARSLSYQLSTKASFLTRENFVTCNRCSSSSFCHQQIPVTAVAAALALSRTNSPPVPSFSITRGESKLH